MPLLMLNLDRTSDERWTMFGLASAHYIGLGLTMLLLGMIVLPILLNPVLHDLREAISLSLSHNGGDSPATDQVKLILQKLDKFFKEINQQNAANVVFALAFGR